MRLPLMTEVFLIEKMEASTDVSHPPKGKGMEASRDVSTPPEGKGLEPEHNVEYLAQSPMDMYSSGRWDQADADTPGLALAT
ncbi:MAG: hypothetical protein ACYDHY_06480 [Acidiferrobacterales bacterium]